MDSIDNSNNKTTDIDINLPENSPTIDSALYSTPSLSSTNSSTSDSTTSFESNHNDNINPSRNANASMRTSNEMEYSADIKPLSFKMNIHPNAHSHTHAYTNHHSHSHSHSHSHKDLMDIQDDSLHPFNYLKNNNINNNNNSNTFQLNDYSIFDNEQFKSFLEKPKYIKIYRNMKNKSKNVGVFNKLFLAQELSINNNNIHASSSTTTTFSSTNNTLDTSNSKKILGSGGRLSVSSSDSNNIHSNKHTYGSNNNNSSNKNPHPNSCTNSNGKGKGNNSLCVMSLKFSISGKYMAVGYKDGSIRVWKIISSPAERWELNNIVNEDHDFLLKNKRINQLVHTTTHMNSSNTNSNSNSRVSFKNSCSNTTEGDEVLSPYAPVFNPNPIITFVKGHLQDVLDMDWSKNDFLLTSSMDKTVKLWHVEKSQSLKTFPHVDFVTSVRFHPMDDRFFISGCLDHYVRLWSIVDNSVCFNYNCHDFITSLTIASDGGITIVGTFNGFIHVLETSTLTPVTSFHITDKSTQGIHSKCYENMDLNGKVFKGPRITGIEFIEDEIRVSRNRQIIVTSNDSRIRIFDIKSRKLLEYLKGFSSGSSQHLAQYVKYHNKGIVVCSSDDHWVYGWILHSDRQNNTKTKNNLNDNGIGQRADQKKTKKKKNEVLNLLNGSSKLLPLKFSKVFPNNITSNDRSVKKNSKYLSFHAHHHAVTTTVIAPNTTSKILSLSNDFICEITLQYLRELRNNNELNGCSELDRMDDKSKNLLDDKLMKSAMEYNLPDATSIIGPIIVTSDSHGIVRIFRFDMRQDVRDGILAQLKKQELIMKHSFNNNNNIDTSNNTAATATTATTTKSNSFDMLDQSVFSSNRTLTRSTNLESKELNNIPFYDSNEVNHNSNGTEKNYVYDGDRDDNTKMKNVLYIEDTSVNKNTNSNQGVKDSGGLCPRKSNVSNLFTKLSTGSDSKSLIDSSRSKVRNDKSPLMNDTNNIETFPRIAEEGESNHSPIGNTYSAPSSRNNTINNISALNLRCSTCNGTRFELIRKNSSSQGEMSYRCVDCNTILNNFR